MARRRVRKRRRPGSKIPLMLAFVDILLIGLWVWRFAPWAPKELTVEVGSAVPSAQDFIGNDVFKAEEVEGLWGINMNSVADHKVTLKVFGIKMPTTLHVVDSVAPVVTVKDVETYVNAQLSASMFIESVSDSTATTFSFVQEPNTSQVGMQQVQIAVTDEGGNVTRVNANLNVIPDTEAPVISGVTELTVVMGNGVSYKKGVTVIDNCDTDVELVIDNSAVNLGVPGVYTVIYRATDHSGNTAEVSTKLYVITPMEDYITEDAVYEAAEDILADLFPKGLENYSQYDIIKALYWFCHDNIRYVDSSNKDNWVEAAYRGLVERQGDCYVYAMSAKVLLTKAGIPNRDIAKIPTNTLHYWNLVNIGEGWHHFDTTRRADGSTFFYLTNSQLMKYSDAHRGTHAYDTDVYTDIVP